MKIQPCARETDLWTALAEGQWPHAAAPELRVHVDGCTACRELAGVAAALARDAQDVHRAATPPSSAIVWWRAQMRARQEAARAVDRPITIVHGLAIASTAGLLLGIAGTLAAAVRGSSGWIGALTGPASTLATLVTLGDFTSGWLMYPAALVLLSLIFMPVAIYAIMRE